MVRHARDLLLRHRMHTGAAIAALVLGVIAFAIPAVGQEQSGPAPIAPASVAPPAGAAPPRAVATLGVLRRERRPGDGISAARNLLASDEGANHELARLARSTPSGEKLYVVPASDGVCSATAREVRSCAPSETVIAGSAYQVDVCVEGLPAELLRYWGIVPDGVGHVNARLEAGNVVEWSVVNNMYVAEIGKGDAGSLPTAISFTEPAGTQRVVPYAVPQDLARATCEASGVG